MSVLTILKEVVCDEMVRGVGREEACYRHFSPGFGRVISMEATYFQQAAPINKDCRAYYEISHRTPAKCVDSERIFRAFLASQNRAQA
jgi:hypothetical protein